MPAWLITVLVALWEVALKMLRVTKRDLAVAVVVFLLCGVGAVLLAQGVVRPFLGRVDSMQVQIDSLKVRDAHLARSDSLIVAGLAQVQQSANTNLVMQLLDSPLLAIEEKADITTRMAFGEDVNGDSLSKLLALRKNRQLLQGRR